jgi:hypothetical protein
VPSLRTDIFDANEMADLAIHKINCGSGLARESGLADTKFFE